MTELLEVPLEDLPYRKNLDSNRKKKNRIRGYAH